MDNEYKNDEYQYGNTSNQPEEQAEQPVENVAVQQEAEEVEGVNFVMHSSETQEEPEQEADSPIYSLKGSEVQQDLEVGDSATQSTSESARTGAGYNYNYSYH